MHALCVCASALTLRMYTCTAQRVCVHTPACARAGACRGMRDPRGSPWGFESPSRLRVICPQKDAGYDLVGGSRTCRAMNWGAVTLAQLECSGLRPVALRMSRVRPLGHRKL